MTDGIPTPPGAPVPGPGPWPARPPMAAPPYPASSEPDWAALAARTESEERRKRLLRIGGIVLAAGAVGGLVATAAVVSGGGKAKPVVAASPLPSATASPSAASPSASVSAAPSTPPPSPSASASASSAQPVVGPTVPGQPGVLADHAGHGNNITLSAGAGLKAVTGGYALNLGGNANSYAQAGAALVDTSRSFTVSAWVYNDAAGGSRYAISQGAGGESGFDLGRSDAGGTKAWSFRVQTGAGAVAALAPSPSTNGQWVLLTGVYDAGTHTIQLYVNGAAAAGKPVPGITAEPGPLELGRDRRGGAWTDPWAGVIGHIQVWNQALNAGQVAATFKNGGPGAALPPIASWLV